MQPTRFIEMIALIFPPLPLALLWLGWLVQAVLSVLQVRKAARMFDRHPRDRHDAFRPFATVIVPFKGLDTDLEAHVQSLFELDYPDYELLLIVDSPTDPAYPVLAKHVAAHPDHRAEILVAGPAGPHEGQKVHNQLFAIDHLDARPPAALPQPWVWVFADSDAIPGNRWLADLVGPLGRQGAIGLTTGYRWLIPTPHRPDAGHPATPTPNRATIWSHLASIMNSSVACFYKADRFSYAWGGSMALLAQTARRGELRQKLVGALCDDYQFSRMCRELGLRVYYVPWCLVATHVDFTLTGLINFAHRQYLLTRVYAPWLYLGGLTITSLYVAGFCTAGAALVGSVTGWFSTLPWWWPAATLTAVSIADQVRSTYRRRVVAHAFDVSGLQALRLTLWLDRWATPLWMTLHWLLIFRAALGRTMRWRGVRYRLFAPQRVDRLI